MFAEGALASARRAGEPRFVANALSNLGAIVLAAGDEQRAEVVLEEAVTLAHDVGDERITALALNNLGDLALATGDYARARPLFEESLDILRARGDTANIARSLFNRGAVDLVLGDHSAAAARFREGLALASDTDDKEDLAWCLEGLAAVAVRERNESVRPARRGRRPVGPDGRRLQAVRATTPRGDAEGGGDVVRACGAHRCPRARVSDGSRRGGRLRARGRPLSAPGR